MSETPLDRAHAAMAAAPEDDTARLKFFERLADSEVYLMLDEQDATGQTPLLFETSDGKFVLAFDGEDRLAAFAGAPAPYAALSGRGVAAMLAGRGVGIALNPEVAASSMLIPADAMDWLTNLLADAPAEQQATPSEVRAPSAPARLVEALDSKLASAAGLATHALLADATYVDGKSTHLLAVIDAALGAEAALAQAVSEALIFSDLDAGILDVAFFAAADPITEKLARVALRIDLPVPETPKPPSFDSTKPPKLR